MAATQSIKLKDHINKIFSDCEEHFSYPHFTQYFDKKPVNLKDFLSIRNNPINVMPESDDDWDNLVNIIKRHESSDGIMSLQECKEDTKERIEKILSYLSCPNSFLFLNVGSFHNNVFNSDKRMINMIKNRLKEEKFRFIVSSANYVMMKNGHNTFLETLLKHPDKGVVVNAGKRMPLHFISVAYDSVCGPRTLISFEHEHDESQNIRKRYTPYSIKSLNLLYASQLKQILKNGFLVQSVNDFEEYNGLYA